MRIEDIIRELQVETGVTEEQLIEFTIIYKGKKLIEDFKRSKEDIVLEVYRFFEIFKW